jgi:predicted enzyme related to lactoylglutathione lyase
MLLLANIDVDDLDKAVKFYGDALGLKVGRRMGKDVVEMLGGSSALYLLRKAAGTNASSATARKRDYKRHWTPVHLDFVVEDIRAAAEQAVSAGAALEGAIQTHNWGSIARMADPFGHGFCLIQFRGRGYSEITQPN